MSVAVTSAFAEPTIDRTCPQRQSRWSAPTIQSIAFAETFADVYIVADPHVTGAIINLYGNAEVVARYGMDLQYNSLAVQGEVPYVQHALSLSPVETQQAEYLRSGDNEPAALATPWPPIFPQSLRTRSELMLSRGEADLERMLAITMAVSPKIHLNLQGVIGTALTKGRLASRPHYNPYSDYFTLFMQD